MWGYKVEEVKPRAGGWCCMSDAHHRCAGITNPSGMHPPESRRLVILLWFKRSNSTMTACFLLKHHTQKGRPPRLNRFSLGEPCVLNHNPGNSITVRIHYEVQPEGDVACQQPIIPWTVATLAGGEIPHLNVSRIYYFGWCLRRLWTQSVCAICLSGRFRLCVLMCLHAHIVDVLTTYWAFTTVHLFMHDTRVNNHDTCCFSYRQQITIKEGHSPPGASTLYASKDFWVWFPSNWLFFL